MDTNSILITVASSSVIAAILSSLLNFWLSKIQFKNEYYKKVIVKRIETYELLERVVGILKTSVVDSKGNGYHRIFASGEKHYIDFCEVLGHVNSKNTWINPDTDDCFHNLMHIITEVHMHHDISIDSELEKAGKEHYWDIAHLRDKLENHIRRDILNLHKFKEISKKRNKLDEPRIIDTRVTPQPDSHSQPSPPSSQ